MGIVDLLKVLRPCLVKTHISEFRGKVAAVDMMNWIYRGVYSCSIELNAGLDADLYLNFPLKMLSLLKSFNIEIIAVFDGKEILAKEKVDRARKDEKNKNMQLANKFSLEGDIDKARNVSRRALKITGKMLNTLIEVLKKLQIKVIIAPYEADSQIAFLYKTKLCDFIISEDSDLIPFGCNRILYKLGADGEGNYFDYENLEKSDLGKFNLFKTLNKIQKVEFCVLSGCDYLPSLKGLGVKRAIEMFSNNSNIIEIIKEMKKNTIYSQGFKEIVYDYLEEAKKSVAMFFNQSVYDPIQKQIVPVHDDKKVEDYFEKHYKIKFESDNEKEIFFGCKFKNYIDYCNANLDIKTMEKTKEIESEVSIEKYYNKYKRFFCKQDSSYFKQYYTHLANNLIEEENNFNKKNSNIKFDDCYDNGVVIEKKKLVLDVTKNTNNIEEIDTNCLDDFIDEYFDEKNSSSNNNNTKIIESNEINMIDIDKNELDNLINDFEYEDSNTVKNTGPINIESLFDLDNLIKKENDIKEFLNKEVLDIESLFNQNREENLKLNNKLTVVESLSSIIDKKQSKNNSKSNKKTTKTGNKIKVEANENNIIINNLGNIINKKPLRNNHLNRKRERLFKTGSISSLSEENKNKKLLFENKNIDVDKFLSNYNK